MSGLTETPGDSWDKEGLESGGGYYWIALPQGCVVAYYLISPKYNP